MIEPSDEAEEVPALSWAPSEMLAAGSVYVQCELDDGQHEPQLPDGKKVVLEQGGAKAELTTRSTMNGNPTGTATIVNVEDYGSFAAAAAGEPTIRLYRFRRDGLPKLTTRAGLRLLATTLVAALTFAGGLWFLLAGDDGTDAATVASRAQTLVEWAHEPAAGLSSASDPAAIRRELELRRVAAANCLRQLRGDKVPDPDVGGRVVCKPSEPEWYEDKDNEAYLTMLLGFVTLMLTLWAASGKFTFGKDPAEA